MDNNSATQTLFRSMRLPFLMLTPACLFLGWSVVITNGVDFDIHLAFLTLIGAISAHISVNTLNEFFDYKSGLDLKTDRTPFSGGSGALVEHPKMHKAVLIVGIVTLLITLAIGLYFIWKYGWAIIPLGLVGALLIVFYTGWINRHPFLCLISPGLGFGFLMVLGAYFSLTGEYPLALVLICLVPFFLINNLLLLNQYPDISPDKRVGRKTFPIVYGIRSSNTVYAIFNLLATLVIMMAVSFNILPQASLLALLLMLLTLYSLKGAVKHGSQLGKHPKYLAANVIVANFVPVVLGLSIIFG